MDTFNYFWKVQLPQIHLLGQRMLFLTEMKRLYVSEYGNDNSETLRVLNRNIENVIEESVDYLLS